MKPRIYERYFLTATFFELFNGRWPAFRGYAAVRNLKRVGIEATCEKHNDEFIRVTALALNERHVAYLEIRGYELKKSARTKPTNPTPAYSDVVKTILARPKTGKGGGIPLTRGEVAMLFLDGYAGDAPSLLDVRSKGYGEDDDWYGLTDEDVLEDENTAVVWVKWEPLELWLLGISG